MLDDPMPRKVREAIIDEAERWYHSRESEKGMHVASVRQLLLVIEHDTTALKAAETSVLALRGALDALKNYAEWHMPLNKHEKQHPTYSRAVKDAYRALASTAEAATAIEARIRKDERELWNRGASPDANTD